MLRLEAVARRFGDLVAVEDVSLRVDAGGFTAILGPSGCGKSTILRMIAGLDQPSAGAVAWSNGPPARGAIGYVFQEPTLMPWASVFENVYLPLRIQGQRRADASPAIEDALKRVGLEEFAGAYPRQLSGGMKMRCAIARALVTRPALLLMDEPFAALDEITRFKLNDELLSLWAAQGWTALFVTHSIYESVYLAKRVLIMTPRPGQIAADIAIDEPYPRTEAYRASARYAASCREISQALRAAMERR